MSVFISYRREDSAFAARSIKDRLSWMFGADQVFHDTDSIRAGENWPERLETAVAGARALIALIGPNWLRASDAYGRRRLDDPGDWVRTEIETALKRGIQVIPVRVGGAQLPPKEALPATIAALTDRQDVELSERSWDAGITHIADRLVELGLRRPVSQVRFPKPLRIVPRALAADELQQKLREHPGWEVCTGKIPGNDATRTEIRKAFEFRSFEDAMDFMGVAAAHISQVRYQPWNVQHHPRWENLWRTVTVWLSTWDNQHVISEVDFLLAEYLDELYQSTYKPQKQGDKVAAP